MLLHVDSAWINRRHITFSLQLMWSVVLCEIRFQPFLEDISSRTGKRYLITVLLKQLILIQPFFSDCQCEREQWQTWRPLTARLSLICKSDVKRTRRVEVERQRSVCVCVSLFNTHSSVFFTFISPLQMPGHLLTPWPLQLFAVSNHRLCNSGDLKTEKCSCCRLFTVSHLGKQ